MWRSRIGIFVVLTVISGLTASQRLSSASAATPLASPVISSMCGNPVPKGTTAPQIKHVIIIVGENESIPLVVGNSNAPYQNNVLAKDCSRAAGMQGVTHGSEVNYLAMTSGQYPPWSLNDCQPDNVSCGGHDTDPSIFSEIDAVPGLSWKSYDENMPSNCDQSDGPGGLYAVRHNPAAFYTPLPSCATDDVPFGDDDDQTGPFYDDIKNGALPSFSLVTPDTDDDSHNSGTANDFDDFLSKVIPAITAGPNYQAGNTAIFVTFDEGCGGACGPDYKVGENCVQDDPTDALPSCHIPTWVIAPFTASGTAPTTYFTHYSLLRTTEDLLGLGHLGHAADSTTASMTDTFNLAPGGLPPAHPSPPPTPIPAPPVGATVIPINDPGFESWPGGWSAYGNATSLSTVTDHRSGDTGLHVATTSTGYDASGIETSPAAISSTTAGRDYFGGCYVKAATPTLLIANAQLEESGHTAATTGFDLPDSTNWHWVGTTDVAQDSGHSMQFTLFSTNTKAGAASFDVDDCEIGYTAAGAATLPPPTTNLLTDPGFESWPGGWSTYGSATALTIGADAHSGNAALNVGTTSSQYNASGIAASPTPVTSTVSGRTYVAGCFVKAATSHDLTVNAELHEAGQAAAVSSIALTDTTTWQWLSVTDTAASNGSAMPFYLFSTNTISGGATFDVDDCSLTAS